MHIFWLCRAAIVGIGIQLLTACGHGDIGTDSTSAAGGNTDSTSAAGGNTDSTSAAGGNTDSTSATNATGNGGVTSGKMTGGGGTSIGSSGSGSPLDGCPVFPADNPWNHDVSNDPVDANSDAIIANIQSQGGHFVHADFGAAPSNGIPYMVVPGDQAKVPIRFTAYANESDPGPYPVPSNAPVEGGPNAKGDRHVLIIDQGACKLYELDNAHYTNPGWDAAGGALFDLRSNALRHECYTSADAAGLPIFAGLVRYEELSRGAIKHALRVTVVRTRQAYVHPATHYASKSTDPNLPPMGARLRLKAGFDDSGFKPQSKAVLQALKRYGMIIADNGSNWFISGAPNPNFNDDDLHTLGQVMGAQFEVIKLDTLHIASDCK